MKAVVMHEHGGPEVLRYEEVPDPLAGPGRSSSGSAPARSTTSTSGRASARPAGR